MFWNAVCTALAAEMPASEYDLWIRPLVLVEESRGDMVLAGTDRFFCAWVEQHYLELIAAKCREVGGPDHVSLRAGDTAALPVSLRAPQGEQLRLPGAPERKMQLRALHPAFTFEQFMVGNSNILAQSACKALALGDRTFGNSLFMNSDPGLGKTHLTQAVVHEVLRSAPSTRLRYLTAQQFTAEMVRDIREKHMDRFQEKYVNDCDMLLLEDVHTLTGKHKTQEELNTVLDYLLKSGRRVILTSSLPPERIEGLDPDFRSRMTSGLLTSIKAPGFNTRVRIIRHKMAAQGLNATDDLAEYMAEQLTGDVRRMESAILNVKARCRLLGATPDLAMLQDILGQTALAPLASFTLTADDIAALVSARFRVDSADLRSRSRKRNFVFPRQVAIYLTRKLTGHSLAEIGARYNRDHSTAMHAIRTITTRMAQETAVREQVELLTRELKKRERRS